jgi:WhiB family transcriptional regulator, redox-sensing transcriptional regulator
VLLAAPYPPLPTLRVDVAARPGHGLPTVARMADAGPYHPPAAPLLEVEAGGNLGHCDSHEVKLTGRVGNGPRNQHTRSVCSQEVNPALLEWLMNPTAPELPDLAGYLSARPSWMESGACRGMAAHTFFIERGGSSAGARAVCRSCPVEAECLAYALSDPELTGVWGATSARERARMRQAVA